MTICPACGHRWAADAPSYTRGPLYATTDPPAVYHKGLRLPLTPFQVAIMTMLIEYGRASHAMLGQLGSTENECGTVVRTQISYIRRKLPDGVTIENVLGWGYRLVYTEP
jgi:DNA-binding response OmpR family regulator